MNLQSIKPCNYSICIFSAWIVTTIGLRSLWAVGGNEEENFGCTYYNSNDI